MRAALAAIAIAAAAPGAAEGAELLGDWRFDEPSGQSVLDGGPYGLDGRLGAGDDVDADDPARVPGLSGGALRFGQGTFVRLPDSPWTAPSALSVEAVVRAAGSPGPYSYLVARGSFECLAGSYGLYTGPGGGAAFYVFDGERFHLTAQAAAADIWDGAWHHLAGTYDGSVLRLYVDGRPVGSPARAKAGIDYGRRTSPSTFFGTYRSQTCRRPFTGDVDGVRLWSGALPEDQVGLYPGLLPVTDRTPLPAEREPTVIAAPPSAPGEGKAQTLPGAPAEACRLRATARRTGRAGRRRVTVRMRVRGRPVEDVLVSLRRNGRPYRRARTDARGTARFRVRVRRNVRLTVRAVYTPRCAPVRVR